MPKTISLDNLARFKTKLDTEIASVKSDIEGQYGQANGVAELDSSGKVPSGQLPADVYNVVEYASRSNFPATGVVKRIYLDKATNNMYRWSGSEYVSVSAPESVKYISQTLTGEQKAQARENIAAASASDVSGLSTTVSELNDRLNNFGNFVREVSETEGGINVRYDNNANVHINTGLDFDGGYVDENNYLYLKKGDTVLSNDVFTPVQLPAGGGGGSGGSAISLSNTVKPSAIRNGDHAVFSFVAASSDDTNITVTWLVNNKLVATQQNISGSTYSLDVQNDLEPSVRNIVEVRIASEGGASLTRKWTIECIAFNIAWGSSIEPIMLNNSNTNVYVPINVSAEANSSNIVTVTVGSHSVSRTVNGSMTITVLLDKSYFTPGVNLITASMVSADDPEDEADPIQFTLIWGTGVASPIVAFASNRIECNQYDLVNLSYFVFDPNNETATCSIRVDAGDPIQLSVNREIRVFQYSPLLSKTYNVVLTCGSSTATAQLIAAPVEYNLNYYHDDSLVYILDPFGHNNSDSDRESFAGLIFNNYDEVSREEDKILFDWENGGFKTDENGASAFVVKKGNTVKLPRCLFEDNDVNGKTIDISFRVANSDQYDAIAMQELNDDVSKGIILKANNGELRLNNVVGQSFRYCEESRIDLSILVENRTDQRIATVWLDGIPSCVNKYSDNMLVQDENVFVIGSEHCDVWIYAIRIYNSNLSKAQMIQNYVSLGSTTNEKINRYKANTILDQNEHISPEALHTASPNLTIVQIAAPRMTVDKSDSVPADITITDGASVLELPSDSGTVFKVQGTSSASYGRSSLNLDIDFKNTGKTYKISESSIPVNYINIKVNVASSENANNINAVDWYNQFQPYITEPRLRPGVRDSVEGKPCAVFITNTNDTAVWFSSILIQPNETVLYAMGDICNSKKNKAVFGQDGSGEHPTKACIEVSGNDTEPQRFRSTAAVFNPEADDGDGRWETSAVVDGQTVVTKHFEWRMVPSSANKTEVVTAWNNLVSWVVSTINNSAKFKSEVGNYFAIDSLLYHFLFLEYFAAYDNVSKNTFYSYDWDENAQKYLWNIKCAYDMDTILAADNDGKPLGDYGLDFGDTVDGQPNGRQYFNAADNPIWVNIKSAFQNELSAMYIALRSNGAWNAQTIMEKWDTYQDLRPHAAMVVDAYNKYIAPYKTDNVILNGEVKRYDDSYLPRLQGSKTYWRKQFLTYQTAYMDGKYGYYSKTNSTQFRTNGSAGTRNYEIKVYAKTYITIIADDNKVSSQKIEAGQAFVFNNVSVGNNTTLYITPDRLVQYIRPLNNTQNSTFVASGATKLMEANLGGEVVNTAWPSGTGVNIPSVILKNLSIKNITNFSDALDLTDNVELETLDTRGTNTGLVSLPSFAPLTHVYLNACTGIAAHNLQKVEVFSIAGGQNLVSIQLENCNAVVSEAIRSHLIEAVDTQQQATRRIRAIGVNWTFTNLDALSKIASTWRGYNSLGEQQNAPVVTGNIHVTNVSKKKLEIINEVWGSGDVEDHLDETNRVWSYGDLSITYDSLIPYYAVHFLNRDGSAIKDRQNQDYIQYVDLGGQAYDPVLAGEIDTPVYVDPTGEFRYTFVAWDNLEGNVLSDKNVAANYTEEKITYRVRWYDKVGGTLYDERLNVEYGSEAVYDPNGTIGLPTLADEEVAGVYKVFMGWDKSTGFIKSNTDVYAVWDRASVPTQGQDINIKDMSLAQIYGIAKTYRAEEFFEDQDYVDITVGKDFNFSNVQSEVLLENRYFNGSEIVKMNNIKLFDANAPSFTLAIDYEFTEATTNATMISCCDSTGNAEGFRVYYYLSSTEAENESIRVLWGDKTATVGHGLNRQILVLRHVKGSKNLLVASDNGGRLITHSNAYGGDDFPDQVWELRRYDGYNESGITTELVRAQDTVTDSVLSFGAMAYGSQGYRSPAKGWIHWCKIWYDDLGTKNSQELASWPHETWRMHYRGHRLYNKDDGTGLMDGASFIANAPLAQFYEMYKDEQLDTEGGWAESRLRQFVNSRCFNALPYGWQSIIRPVSIVTKGGADNYNNLEYTTDKIYVPSCADMTSSVQNLNRAESTQVSWFVTNEDRVKFMGINIPETARVFTTESDPTLYTGSQAVNEFDIWTPPNSGNRAYVYISATTAARHNYIGGRPIDDTVNNVNAVGSQGGVWVRSITYWTRSNNSSTAANSSSFQWTVYPTGVVNQNTYIYYPEYRRRGIVVMFSI